MATIVAVDFSNIFWTNYMVTSTGDPVSAAHDWTVRKVRALAEEHEHIGLACDSRGNWRRDISPTYKAQREERSEAAWAQLSHTLETLRRDGFPVWKVDGYEADDILATVARLARADGHDVIIVSSDKDLRACIRDDDPPVRVLTIGGAHGAPRMITAATCSVTGKAKDGKPILVKPTLVRDFIALVGDGSDNIPGVRGVGPVNAIAMLGYYGSFPGCVAAVEAGEAKMMAAASGKALAAHMDDAKRSWALAELRTDVEVDWQAALCAREPMPVDSPMTRGAATDDADIEGECDDEDGGDHSPPSETKQDQAARLDVAVAQQQAAVAAEPAAAIVRAPVPWSMQLEPSNSGGAVKLAQWLADSRMFPSLPTPEKILAAMMLGRVHGLPAVVACLNCTPIKDRLSMSWGMVIGLVQRSEVCEYIEGVEGDDKSATWVAKRMGRPERSHTFRWEEAVRAGYTATRGGDGSWQKDPAHMLWVRCGTRIARRVFPDVVAGIYSTEELEDS